MESPYRQQHSTLRVNNPGQSPSVTDATARPASTVDNRLCVRLDGPSKKPRSCVNGRSARWLLVRGKCPAAAPVPGPESL